LDPCATVRVFIEAYADGDRARMRNRMADDFVGYVTNAAAGADLVDGPDAYLERLPVLSSADASVRVTQSVPVSADQALTMVEIRATRPGRALHNFGAFLPRSDDEGRLLELWMVDALPADSAAFWA
jgi:hypothetical protein